MQTLWNQAMKTLEQELREAASLAYYNSERDLLIRAAAEIEALRADATRKETEHNLDIMQRLKTQAEQYESVTRELRAELAEAKADTKRIDNLERVVKNSSFQKVSLQTNGSGYITITRRGYKHAGMKALHHGPYYDLREALSAMQEGK